MIEILDKKTIYCVAGKSASGKDTIVREILKKGKSTLKPIVPCTTRPMRAEESEGNPYHFISNEEIDEKMIAKTLFKRTDGEYYYGFLKEDLDETMNYLAVINIAQFKDIYETYHKKFNIAFVEIKTEEEERIIHAIKREEKNDKNYKELCRRILADAKDFSDENEEYTEILSNWPEKRYENINYIGLYNDYGQTPGEIADEFLYNEVNIW